jgi:hypothetical protein
MRPIPRIPRRDGKSPSGAPRGAAFLRSELILDGDASVCLAREADTLPCLLDIGQFNRRVLTRKMFEKEDPDAVRAKVIREALEASFWVGKAKAAGLELDASADSEAQAHLDFRQGREAKRILSRKEFGDDLLRRIYDQQYRARFMAARDARLRILGSSDRGFLERIAGSLRPMDAASPGRAHGVAPSDSLPWVETLASDLPEALSEAVDSLVPGKHVLVSTGFGYFLLRLVAWEKVPEEPFEAVRPVLRELAIREDPDLEYRALAYWHDHRRQFPAPDTLVLKAWLNPFPQTRGAAAARKQPDSGLSGRPFLVLRDFDLPETVRSALPDSFLVRDSLYGPVSTALGAWFFQLTARKPNGRPLPFRAVRDRIKEMVLLPAPDLYQSLAKELKGTLKEDLMALAVQQRALADSSQGQAGRDGLPGYGSMLEEKSRWMARIKTPFGPVRTHPGPAGRQ